jgi:hypothetical protein
LTEMCKSCNKTGYDTKSCVCPSHCHLQEIPPVTKAKKTFLLCNLRFGTIS